MHATTNLDDIEKESENLGHTVINEIGLSMDYQYYHMEYQETRY